MDRGRAQGNQSQQKLNSTAASTLNPTNMPPSMVIRLRLVPGIMATHWSAPTVSALPGVRLSMEAPESPSLERPSLVRQAQYARITPPLRSMNKPPYMC